MLHFAKLVAGMIAVVGLVLVQLAAAQQNDDVDALNAEISKLYGEGRYAEGVPLAQRVLDIRLKAAGPDSPDTAGSLNNLALLQFALGRNAEAESLYKRSLSILEKALGPNHPAVATSLNNLAAVSQATGRYADAAELFLRSLSISDKTLGPGHPNTASTLSNLAELYRVQGRYAEAEPLFKRSLVDQERMQGPDHPDVAVPLNDLALLFLAQGRYVEAERLFERSLSIRKKALGLDHRDTVTSLNNLAELYRMQGRYAEAEPLFKRVIAIAEKTLGSDNSLVAAALNNLAALYQANGRYVDAEPLYQRSLGIRERALGPAHPLVASAINNLAAHHLVQGRFGEAELLFKRSLGIREKALGREHPDVGESLNNVAAVYRNQGRFAEAEPLFRRVLAIAEKTVGTDHRDTATSLNNLALLYVAMGRTAEAEPLFKRSLSILEKGLGSDHADVGASLDNLASMYHAESRFAEAEPLFRRSLAIRERVLGLDHPDVAAPLNNLALMYQDQGRYAEAEPLYKRALSIKEKALSPDHPLVATALSNLAALHFVQSDWLQAANYWLRSNAIIIDRAQRTTETLGAAQTSTGKREAVRNSFQFLALVKVAYRLATADPASAAKLGAAMFQTAQWALSSDAASSLALMASRGATGSSLAAIVRERQDAIGEWQNRDAARDAALAQPSKMRDNRAEATNVARLGAIDIRLSEIDQRLKRDFPDYAALANPKPLSIADVQSELREDEALVLFLDTPVLTPTTEETFVWVVTRTDSRWVKSDLGTNALRERISALRCGLDPASWFGDGRARCTTMLGLDSATAWQPDDPLPFNLSRSFDLYAALFGGIEDLIQGKSLIIVPSGPLTSLPFQVLVTEAPNNRPYAKAPWLIRKHALTILPSVASLTTLRRNSKPSVASDPFIGYGNPVLSGHPSCSEITVPATCPQDNIQVAAAVNRARSIEAVGSPLAFIRSGRTDVSAIRNLCPLPDTAHELACVAKSLGAPPSSSVLGKDMTETAVKHADLTRYRIIHFATHGLLAGETAQFVKAGAEPALVMSPPQTPTEEDDGLLAASEIAALKLDADWVVMSACNTAAGGEPGAEALSGLGRAFFYAGARALLVSHWPVNSYAATMLTSRTFAELSRNPKGGRAEAFRLAMLAELSDQKRPWAAHPSFWAPFIIVGEGGGQSGTEAAAPISEPSSETSATATAPASARKKTRRRAKPNDDWITGIFGQ